MNALTGTPGSESLPENRATRSRWVAWVLGLLVLAVVGTGILAGILREPTTLDPNTPEGTVQAYLQAVLDEDWSSARAHLADDLARRCSVVDFRYAWVPDQLTTTLDGTRTTDDGVEVRVQLRSVASPDPLRTVDGVSTETFDLVQQDGQWRITGAPWPVMDCRGW
jgi:hypothetical protein